MKAAVETSNAVDSAYSLTSSPSFPTTNIFVPSAENARPVGRVSWALTENESVKAAVETSKVAPNPLPPVSRTAAGSIASSGESSAFTAARLAAFSVKVIVAESALVPSSAAESVTPPVAVPASLTWNLAGSMFAGGVASMASLNVISNTPVPRSSVAEENVGGTLMVPVRVIAKAELSAYSLASSTSPPTTNILAPSSENARPVG